MSNDEHAIGASDFLWRLGQKRWGVKNPASKFRELIYSDMIRWAAGTSLNEPPEQPVLVVLDDDNSQRWAQLKGSSSDGCELDKHDVQFRNARQAFVDSWDGDELAAIEWLEMNVRERGMLYPRRWLMRWYYAVWLPEQNNTTAQQQGV